GQFGMFGIMRSLRVFEAGNARVVHKNVESAMPCQQVVDGPAPLVFRADIEAKILCPGAELRGFARSQLIANVAQNHDRTFRMKCLRDRGADATSCAGYESDL